MEVVCEGNIKIFELLGETLIELVLAVLGVVYRRLVTIVP